MSTLQEQFHQNHTINPETGHLIQIDDPTYRRSVQKYGGSSNSIASSSNSIASSSTDDFITSSRHVYVYFGDFHAPNDGEWSHVATEISHDREKLKKIKDQDISDILDLMEEEGLKAYREKGLKRSQDDDEYEYIYIDHGIDRALTPYYTSAIIKKSIQ